MQEAIFTWQMKVKEANRICLPSSRLACQSFFLSKVGKFLNQAEDESQGTLLESLDWLGTVIPDFDAQVIMAEVTRMWKVVSHQELGKLSSPSLPTSHLTADCVFVCCFIVNKGLTGSLHELGAALQGKVMNVITKVEEVGVEKAFSKMFNFSLTPILASLALQVGKARAAVLLGLTPQPDSSSSTGSLSLVCDGIESLL